MTEQVEDIDRVTVVSWRHGDTTLFRISHSPSDRGEHTVRYANGIEQALAMIRELLQGETR